MVIRVFTVKGPCSVAAKIQTCGLQSLMLSSCKDSDLTQFGNQQFYQFSPVCLEENSVCVCVCVCVLGPSDVNKY